MADRGPPAGAYFASDSEPAVIVTDVDAKERRMSLGDANESLLYRACVCGDAEEVARLLADGVNPMEHKATAFLAACTLGYSAVVEYILSDPRMDFADLNILECTFRVVVHSQRLGMLDMLLDDFKLPLCEDALVTAVQFGVRADMVDKILAHPGCKDEWVEDSLRAGWGVARSAPALLRVIPDRRIRPCYALDTLLMRACQDRVASIIDLLAEDPRVDPSHYGGAAIAYAARDGNVDLVQRLLRHPRTHLPSCSELPDAAAKQPAMLRMLIADGRLNLWGTGEPLTAAMLACDADIVAHILSTRPAAPDISFSLVINAFHLLLRKRPAERSAPMAATVDAVLGYLAVHNESRHGHGSFPGRIAKALELGCLHIVDRMLTPGDAFAPLLESFTVVDKAVEAAVKFNDNVTLDALLAQDGVKPRINHLHFTMLQAAALGGNADVARRVLAEPTFADYVKLRGFKALCRAAREGHVSVIQALLADERVAVCRDEAAGSSLRDMSMMVEEMRIGPLSLAARAGQLAVVEALLAHPRIDPTHNHNVVSHALVDECASSLAIMQLLLADPRIDPASFVNSANACPLRRDRHGTPSGDAFRFLLLDPRVDPSAGGNCALVKAVHAADRGAIMRLLCDGQVLREGLPGLGVDFGSFMHDCLVDLDTGSKMSCIAGAAWARRRAAVLARAALFSEP